MAEAKLKRLKTFLKRCDGLQAEVTGAAVAQLVQQKAWSPRETMVDSSTMADAQWLHCRSPGWLSGRGSEPPVVCSTAAAQLAQQ